MADTLEQKLAAFVAPAAFAFDVLVKVVRVVVIVQFLASLDVFLRKHKDALPVDVYLAIWGARVVDVARRIRLDRAIYRFVTVDGKQILTVAGILFFF